MKTTSDAEKSEAVLAYIGVLLEEKMTAAARQAIYLHDELLRAQERVRAKAE